MHYQLTLRSTNAKTGPIPVSMTSAYTCPDACPFKRNANDPFRPGGCYAAHGPISWQWANLTNGKMTTAVSFSQFLDKVRALPPNTFWRHNQAGDLPGHNDEIDTLSLSRLVAANAHNKKRGFTYTHKPATKANLKAIEQANARGFTINLSANSPAHADTLLAHKVAPVVCVLPISAHGQKTVTTPRGNKIVVCPATYKQGVTCQSCQLCQKANRSCVVGFPAHGSGKKQADAIANTNT